MSRQFRTILDMAGNPITAVADPSAPQDAATKNYVDTRPGLANEVTNGGPQPTDGSDIWIDWSGG